MKDTHTGEKVVVMMVVVAMAQKCTAVKLRECETFFAISSSFFWETRQTVISRTTIRLPFFLRNKGRVGLMAENQCAQSVHFLLAFNRLCLAFSEQKAKSETEVC